MDRCFLGSVCPFRTVSTGSSQMVSWNQTIWRREVKARRCFPVIFSSTSPPETKQTNSRTVGGAAAAWAVLTAVGDWAPAPPQPLPERLRPLNSAGMRRRNQVGFHEQVSVVFLPHVSHTVSPPVLISTPSQVFFFYPPSSSVKEGLGKHCSMCVL